MRRPDELDERQHGHRVEEVDADVGAHLGHRKARGVGREDAAGLGVLAQLGEDLLLDVELLEDGLEHQVAVGEVLVAGRGREQRAEEARLAFVVASPGDLLGERLVDGLPGGGNRVLAEIAHRDRDLEAP